jgi:hypothetical protein
VEIAKNLSMPVHVQVYFDFIYPISVLRYNKGAQWRIHNLRMEPIPNHNAEIDAGYDSFQIQASSTSIRFTRTHKVQNQSIFCVTM